MYAIQNYNLQKFLLNQKLSRNKRKRDVPLRLIYSVCCCNENDIMATFYRIEPEHRVTSMIICLVYHLAIRFEANFATYFVPLQFLEANFYF